MINLYGTQIEEIAVHQVGNRCKKEGINFNNQELLLNDETNALLKEYFFKPFREKEENYYSFSHEADLELNEVYNHSSIRLDGLGSTLSISTYIAEHLYDQSNHPHIKGGEVYVCYLTNIILDNEKVDAIGIFKSEVKHDFIEFEKKGQSIDMIVRQGINVNRLDKGCLILNTQKEAGYKVLSVDNNRYDSKYWLVDFLGIETLNDDNFKTKNYLKFCKDFASEIVKPLADKQQEVLFINKSFNHFAQNDNFIQEQFLNEVVYDDQLKDEFLNYKIQKGPKYNIEELTEFDISNKSVSEARKNINTTIKLDTNISLKMDFINPESMQKFVEKGWDEEKQMYYYLVYFNKEEK